MEGPEWGGAVRPQLGIPEPREAAPGFQVSAPPCLWFPAKAQPRMQADDDGSSSLVPAPQRGRPE